MWGAESFDPDTMAEELAWAQGGGLQRCACIPAISGLARRSGWTERADRFLDIASGCGIKAMFIVFDDCAFAGKEPYLGPQDDPVPNVHNSGWTPSPGLQRVGDRSVWPALKDYVVDIVGSFADDERVQIWDLYNEPGNSEMGESSLPLVEAAFAWAREADAGQPLTTSIFRMHDATWRNAYWNYPMSRRFITTSRPAWKRSFSAARHMADPCFVPNGCGDRLANGPADIADFRAASAWYNWGLVAGRTQTYLDWRREMNTPDNKTWQHDIFHADGSPYDQAEIKLSGLRFRH